MSESFVLPNSTEAEARIDSVITLVNIPEIEQDWVAIKFKLKEIERLNARINDYQDACAQKQEIINGCTQDIESLTARIKELEDKLEAYQSSDDAFEELRYE